MTFLVFLFYFIKKSLKFFFTVTWSPAFNSVVMWSLAA